MRAKTLVVVSMLVLGALAAATPARSETLCFGRSATIQATGGVTEGTPGADVIVGSAGADVIRGLGGNDRICGLGGNDRLLGMGGRDRLSGGEGDDILRGGAGTLNILAGDAGDDVLVALSYGDKARGGGGDDRIDARQAGFAVLRGGGGQDTIMSGYRDDLDAGAQKDHCGLAPGVAGTNCETLELLCPPPQPFPIYMPNPTTGYGDFDGDGEQDTIKVANTGTVWRALLTTTSGYGEVFNLPTDPALPAAALGGHDINGDGIDEIFLKVGAGAYTDIVGLYALKEPTGTPADGLSCGVQAVTLAGGARAEFPVGASLMNASGLACLPNHTLREIAQDTVDGTHFTQDRFDYDYLPDFGTGSPHLGMPAASALLLTVPGDQAAIQAAGTLACGGL